MSLLRETSAGLLLAAFPAAAQESPLPDLFSDVIDVRVVNVEVVVTDGKKNRIRGLHASDFELLVDGDPVPISYFTEIAEGRALASADAGVSQVPAVDPGESVGTNYLIFIDDLSAIRRDRDRVLQELETDLGRLGPLDRVAIVAYDGHNVARLTDWTSSRDAIGAALVQAREREARGLLRNTDLGGPFDQTRRVVMAATATVRSFAGARGRKVMLLLAGSWSPPTGPEAYLPRRRGPPPTPVTLRDLYGPLVAAANLVGYTLYPVDVPGFRTSVDLGLSRSYYGAHSGFWGPPPYILRSAASSHLLPYDYFAHPFAPNGSVPLGPSADVEWRQEDPLRYLAQETGGLPMINAQRVDALALAADDTRSYYWLGFEPPRAEDDELHDITVRLVGRRGLRIRAREHYLDMSKSSEVTILVEGSLLFGGAPGTESLDIRFGTPTKAGYRKIVVPMEVRIPLDDVTLLPMAGRWMNELEFRITVINESGDRSEIPMSKVAIAGSEPPSPGQFFVFDTGVKMRKREHRYVAAVYDPLSGAILSATGTLGPHGSP